MSVARTSPPGAARPLIAAGHLQHWLLAARELLAPDASSRFFAALPAGLEASIVEASPLAWMPAELTLPLAELMVSSLGARTAHEFHVAAFLRLMGTSRWRSLVATGARLFGATPRAFVRWFPRGWNAIYRDAGAAVTEEDEESRGRIVLSGVPPVLHGSRAWLDALASNTHGMLRICEREGVVRLDDRGRAEGRIVLTLVW